MKRLFGNESSEDRLRLLKDNCVAVVKHQYSRRYTHAELVELRDRLSELVLRQDEIKRAQAEVTKEYKEQLRPIKDELGRVCCGLRDKARTVREECYVLSNHETGMAEYFNADGEMVFERPLDVSERQENLPGVIKMPALAKGA
jgi:predicted transcriptional regulator